MKRIISVLIATLIMLSANAFAAENFVDKLHSQLKDKDGVTLVNISKVMLDDYLGRDEKSTDDSEEQIEGIKILNIDLKEAGMSDSKVKSISKEFIEEYKSYDVLFEAIKKNETVRILVNKAKKDFVMLVANNKEIVVINSKGITSWMKLMNLSAVIGVDVYKMMMEHKK